MQIFTQTKNLVKKEKEYTAKILKNLKIIEQQKLYADLKYPSLFSYLKKELGYSEAEATVRVNCVRFMLKSKIASKKVESGEIKLTAGAEAGKFIKNEEDEKKIEKVVEKASKSQSTQQLKDFLNETFEKPRREVLVLDERTLDKFDRVKKLYPGEELSSYEIIQILLEEKIRAPKVVKAKVNKKLGIKTSESSFENIPKSVVTSAKKKESCTKNLRGNIAATQQNHQKRSRYIPVKIKREVYKEKCQNCSKRYDLEYDHKLKFSHGGKHEKENLQILCRSCNMRKEIVSRQLGLFA